MRWLERYMTNFPRAPEGGGGGGAGAGAGEGGGAAGGAGGAGAGGGGAKPWYDGIDAETIGHWDNKGWKKDDAKALATELTKAWKGLEKHIGAPADQIIRLPKDANDEAGWKQVYNRLGVPAEAKDYDLSGVKFKDGTDLDAGFVDTMRKALLGAGVTKDKASAVVKPVVDFMDAADAAEAEARAATLQADRTALQKEWGPNWEFNRLTAMQGAKRAAGTDDGAQKIVAAMEQAIGYKATMEFWRKIGAGTTEDTFVDSKAGGGNPTTRSGAVARKAELMADAEWTARYLKGGVKERQEMENLNLLIAGEAA